VAEPRRLVLGLGNPARGDDAVGRVVAQALRLRVPPDVRVVESDGEATAVLTALEQADAAWLVDAARSGAAPGTIHRIDCAAGVALPHGGAVSSHGFGVAEAIALARSLGMLPERCTVYAIEGADFAPGAKLSPAAEAAVATVVARLLSDLAASAPLRGALPGDMPDAETLPGSASNWRHSPMTDDPVRKGEAVEQRLRDQGHEEHAEHIAGALRGGAVGEALLSGLREACQTVLTALEAIDPVTEGMIEELRLEVDKRLQPRH